MKNEGTEMKATIMENKEHEEAMTPMDHVKKYFKHEFSDEMEGCQKYLNLAEKVKEVDSSVAYGLYEMAKDEYTHAKFIHDHLIEWGCQIPEEEMSMYHQTVERIKRIFH